MLKAATASRKFMPLPAASTPARIPRDLPAKLPGAVGSSSPSIFTKAPNGIQLIEYITPPRWKPHRRGGRPKPNSRTVIPESRAVTKCPSSWTNIIKLRMGRNHKTFMIASARDHRQWKRRSPNYSQRLQSAQPFEKVGPLFVAPGTSEGPCPGVCFEHFV